MSTTASSVSAAAQQTSPAQVTPAFRQRGTVHAAIVDGLTLGHPIQGPIERLVHSVGFGSILCQWIFCIPVTQPRLKATMSYLASLMMDLTVTTFQTV